MGVTHHAGMAAGRNVVAKTASYTVKQDENGTVFTTTGAGAAVTFTLPAKKAGLMFEFINTVDQDMTITSDVADTVVTTNDATADSVAFSTSSEKIGAYARAICDGTKWIIVNLSNCTATVAT